MVLNAVKVAAVEAPHCVGSLTVALFILLNCMQFISPLISLASLRNNLFLLYDSLSVLKSIANCKCDHPLLVDSLNMHPRLICDNKDIVFVWVPGHVGKQCC